LQQFRNNAICIRCSGKLPDYLATTTYNVEGDDGHSKAATESGITVNPANVNTLIEKCGHNFYANGLLLYFNILSIELRGLLDPKKPLKKLNIPNTKFRITKNVLNHLSNCLSGEQACN
jgi:hypothetical protein